MLRERVMLRVADLRVEVEPLEDVDGAGVLGDVVGVEGAANGLT